VAQIISGAGITIFSPSSDTCLGSTLSRQTPFSEVQTPVRETVLKEVFPSKTKIRHGLRQKWADARDLLAAVDVLTGRHAVERLLLETTKYFEDSRSEYRRYSIGNRMQAKRRADHRHQGIGMQNCFCRFPALVIVYFHRVQRFPSLPRATRPAKFFAQVNALGGRIGRPSFEPRRPSARSCQRRVRQRLVRTAVVGFEAFSAARVTTARHLAPATPRPVAAALPPPWARPARLVGRQTTSASVDNR
jgi:hypothetical protein